MSYNRKSGRNSYGTFGKGNPGKPRGAHHNPTQPVLALIDRKGAASLVTTAIWRRTAPSSMEKTNPRYSDGTQNAFACRMSTEAMAMCAARVLVSANCGMVTVPHEYRLYTHTGCS
ncbi:hypothetical protein [Hyphomonas jannaschiana]|uniref:hypothetical protein n=1 Tax=Hyphomonas jannaschiana TaxID=86 RepID=UPI0035C6D383